VSHRDESPEFAMHFCRVVLTQAMHARRTTAKGTRQQFWWLMNMCQRSRLDYIAKRDQQRNPRGFVPAAQQGLFA
jgi:hypothetical protein